MKLNENQKLMYGAISIGIVAIILPVTIFVVNQQQDIRQQASQEIAAPTLPPVVKGCPETNPDGTKNTCRPTLYCLTGEQVRYEGNDECTKRLNRESFCCTSR